MQTPKPPACAECGSDPIFHRMTYYTILIDDSMKGLLDPGFVGAWFNKLAYVFEEALTPPLFALFSRIGWGKRIAEPDDATQLLALMLWQEADTRGIEVSEFRLFDLPRNLFLATLPSGRRIAYEGIPLPPSVMHRVSWLDDKARMKEEFKKRGIPVANGGSAKTYTEAKRLYAKLTPPVITKPYSGSGSRHTTLHVDSEAELKRAFQIAKDICPAVIIEEELVGPVYRATVVDGKLAATLRRDQPYVMGDGIHTVTELVRDANAHPKRQGPYFHQMQIDDAAVKELAWQNLTKESVPAKGQRVLLNQKINWSVGGTTADVTDKVHPENAVLFEQVARELKAPIVGIDFIIEDITKSWKEQERCGVIECNSMPFFDNHHLPFEGEPRNVAKLIWDMVLRSH
jgi:D-alanine-D-alanine ligase-like ATP-grasp enzyme